MSKILPLTFLLRFATQALASVATLPNRSLGLQDACVGFAVRLALPLKGEEEKRENETIGGGALSCGPLRCFSFFCCVLLALLKKETARKLQRDVKRKVKENHRTDSVHWF